MDESVLEKISQLFKEGYKQVYSEGHFEGIQDGAKEGQIVESVSMFVSTFLNRIAQEFGEADPAVLYAVGSLLVSDIINALGDTGVEVTEEDITATIQEVSSQVLMANQNIADSVANDPEAQGIIEGQPPQQQGVLGGLDA